MKKLLLWVALLAFSSLQATSENINFEVYEYQLIQVPSRLGNVDLYLDQDRKFHVIQNGVDYKVQNCFVDSILRDISAETLTEFFKGGYIVVDQYPDGDFTLKARGRILGSGPLFGQLVYWVTKVVVYSVVIAATGTAIITTGGIAGGIAGMASGGAALAAGTAAGTAGPAAGIIAAGIVGAGGATTAAAATATVIVGAGGIANAMALAEATAIGLGTAAAFAPTL